MNSRLLQLLGVLIFIFGIGMGIELLYTTYGAFINKFISITNIEDKRSQLNSLITVKRFGYIRILPFGLSLLGGLIFLLSSKIAKIINRILGGITDSFRAMIQIPKAYLIPAIGIIFISFIINSYFAVTMPVFYDEAWTYLNFTKRGFFFSWSYYPAPNNHILHSLLTSITRHFPFGQTVNLRIPNLIVCSISSILFFYSFSKILNEKIAFFLLCIFCFLFPVMYYGYCSRGYSLLLLAFLICFHAGVKIIQDGSKNIDKQLFVLSIGGVLGGFTIPSFLYPYIAISSFVFLHLFYKKDHSNVVKLLLSSVFTGGTVFLLYVPVFIVTGINAVTRNHFVEPVSRLEVSQNLVVHFEQTTQFLFNLPLLVVLLFLFLIGTYLIQQKSKDTVLVLLVLYIVLISPVLLICHSVIPFPRTWIYLIIPCLLLMGMLIKQIRALKETVFWTKIVPVLIAITLVINFRARIYEYEKFSFAAKILADYLVEKEANMVYCNHPLIETNLAYTFEERKKNIKTIFSYYKPYSEDEQLINQPCDYLILAEEVSPFDGYELAARMGESLFVYKKR